MLAIDTTTATAITTTISTMTARAASSNLVDYQGNNNQTYTFLLTGIIGGTVWDTTIYTDDSHLPTAAVHSGFVQISQASVVTVTILSGQSSYTGSTQNGVTSVGYSGWSGSYSIISATE